MKKLFFISILALFFTGCMVSPKQNQNHKTTDYHKTIEQVLGTNEPLDSSYTIQETNDLSTADLKRIQIRATVPSGLDSATILKNMKHIILTTYKKYKADRISGLIYEEGDNIHSTYTVAMSDFAPGGDWSDTRKFEYLDSYAMTMNYKGGYFKSEKQLFTKGDKVLFFEDKEWNRDQKKYTPATHARIFNSTTEWTDNTLVVKVPNKSIGTVTDINKRKGYEGGWSYMYKVKVQVNGKSYEGWAFPSVLKSN